MREFFRTLRDRRMLLLFVLGFSSGLPFLLIGSPLKLWLQQEGISITTIGLFTAAGLPYTLKFVWSPIFDRFVPGFLGRRRGWMLITQLGLLLAIMGLSTLSPHEGPGLVAAMALLIAFLGASQDTVVDAYRWEILEPKEYGVGTSVFVTGYRIALLIAGAVPLILADPIYGVMSWSSAYKVMAALMLIGIGATLFATEPKMVRPPPKNFQEAVIDPFKDYLLRPGALWMLAFILFYKLGDNFAAVLSYPFYADIHFTSAAIGTVVKFSGLIGTVFGAFIGGALILRAGIVRALWICGLFQAVSTVAFSILAWYGETIGPGLLQQVIGQDKQPIQALLDAQSFSVLAAVVLIENIAGGMGTSAFLSFMGNLTNKKYTATQYALFTSLMQVPMQIFGSGAGFVADRLGWMNYFIFSALLAIPGLLILLKIGKWTDDAERDAHAKVSRGS